MRVMKLVISVLAVGALSLVLPLGLAGQAAAGPDLLVLTSGERLTGHLQDVSNGKVDFASDGLGKISVDWSKVQELHAAELFAVIRKGVKLSKNASVTNIPQGTIAATGQTITVMPQAGAPQTIPVADASHAVPQRDFLNAVQHNPNFLTGWTGTASLGAALVQATQSSTSISTSVSLARAIPSETWLEPRNRTTADFNSAYGRISQPATPVVKTSIFHADAERDEYFSGNIFALGNAAFDHSFSQGLDLQQIYGLGAGWTVVKTANRSLDLQGSLTYERQSFFVARLDDNLIGSVFSEDFNQKFAGGITLTQKLAANPAWNRTNAYSANASVVVALPLYKQFSLSASAADSFLNNPPPGFKKNSVQFTTALTYTIK